jgi:hypothetical protein
VASAAVAFDFLVAVGIAALERNSVRLVASRSSALLLDSWELGDKISHTLLLVQVRDRLLRQQGDELTQ